MYQPVTFLISFEDMPNTWWKRFLKKGFTHVSIHRPISGCSTVFTEWVSGICCWINPGRKLLWADIIPLVPRPFLDKVTKTLEVTVDINALSKSRPLFMSCAAIAQYMLGCNLKGTITPYQLYKKLSYMGRTGKYRQNIIYVEEK